MKFESSCRAYQWAVEVLTIWRSGKSYSFDRDSFDKCGNPEYQLLDALTIERIANRHDLQDGHGSLFFAYFMPSPQGEDDRNLSPSERDRLRVRLRLFEAELSDKGFLY